MRRWGSRRRSRSRRKKRRKNGIEEEYLFAFTLQFVDQNLQRFS